MASLGSSHTPPGGGIFTASARGVAAGSDLAALFHGGGTSAGLSKQSHEVAAGAAGARLLSWEVTLSTVQMDHFAVTLANPDLSLLDHPALQMGSVWRMRLGTEGNLSSPHTGVVTTRAGWSTLTLGGEMEDERKLTLTQKQQKWTRRRLSDIAASLFAQAGLVPVVDPTKQLLDVVLRGDETVWQFLKRKAAETGLAYAVYAHTGKGYFVRQGTHKAPRYILSVAANVQTAGNLMPKPPSNPLGKLTEQNAACVPVGEPRLRQDHANVATQETLRGFDPLAKKPFTVTADSRTSTHTLLAGQPAFSSDGSLRDFAPRTSDEKTSPRSGFRVTGETGRGTPTALPRKATAQATVKGRFAAKQLLSSTLTVPVLGNPHLVPGEVLLLDCPARTVAGRWFIQETRHTGQGGSYTTELTLVRNATPAGLAAKPSGGTETSPGAAGVASKALQGPPVNRKPPVPRPQDRVLWVQDPVTGGLVRE